MVSSFVILLFLFLSQQHTNKLEALTKERIKEFKTSFVSILELKSKAIQTINIDYTHWDDMVDFVDNPTEEFKQANLIEAMNYYQYNYMLIIDKNKQTISYDQDQSKLPSIKKELLQFDLDMRKPVFSHYFIKKDNLIIEIFNAPIHSTSDTSREGKPYGYMTIGKIWDEKYIKELQDIVKQPLTILQQKSTQYNLMHPLKSFQNKNIAYIGINLNFKSLDMLKKGFQKQSLFLFISLLIIIFIVSFLIFHYIVKPLTTIANVIKEKVDTSSLQSISKKTDEIGHIAQLVENSFQQTKTLQAYKNALDKSTIVSKTDAEGIITHVNDAFSKISGYNKKECIGRSHNIIRHHDIGKEIFTQMWYTIKELKQIWSGVIKNLAKDGTSYWVKSTIVPILDKNNNIIEYIAIQIDITEQELVKQHFEEKYKVSSKKFSSILNLNKQHENAVNKSNLVSRLDLEGNVIYINQQFLNLSGYTKKEILGNHFSIFIHKEIHFQPYEEAWNHIQTGKSWYGIFNNKSKDGIPHSLDTAIFPIKDEREKITEYMVISHDITKIKEQESLLIQQSKMASMGEMMESIAHQWRQPLSIITTSSSGIKIQKEFGLLDDDKLFNACDSITDSAQHLSDTIDDFRSFFHNDKVKKDFNIKDIFHKTMSLLVSKFKNKEIEIIENIEDINMNGFGNELVQVFMNILNNARDELEIQNIKRMIFIDIYKGNDNVIIKIKDNAGGISEDIIPKIFDSHFTTKEDREGTGIGLHMTKKIIENSFKGTIEASNIEFEYEGEKYIGAVFTIYLPIK